VLYEVVRENLETLFGAIGDGALAVRIPKHARKELEAYLDCGALPRLCPPEVPGVRREPAGGVQLQGPGLLPEVHGTADECYGREPDRAGSASAERALASGC